MSQCTFNIADYRPISAVVSSRSEDRDSAIRKSSGFVVVSSNREPREYEQKWFDVRPAVVDIRSVRDPSGRLAICPRRGKILRFTGETLDRVYTMPSPVRDWNTDDDPGPVAA